MIFPDFWALVCIDEASRTIHNRLCNECITETKFKCFLMTCLFVVAPAPTSPRLAQVINVGRASLWSMQRSGIPRFSAILSLSRHNSTISLFDHMDSPDDRTSAKPGNPQPGNPQPGNPQLLAAHNEQSRLLNLPGGECAGMKPTRISRGYGLSLANRLHLRASKSHLRLPHSSRACHSQHTALFSQVEATTTRMVISCSPWPRPHSDLPTATNRSSTSPSASRTSHCRLLRCLGIR